MPLPRRLEWTQAAPWDIRNRLLLPKAKPGSIAEKAQIVRSFAPPNSQKLPQSVDFNVNDYALALAAGATQTVVGPNLSFAVPPGAVGWLQGATFYVLNQTALTSVRFDIRINGAAIPGFSYQNPPGVANIFLKELSDIAVRLPNGGTVDIIITNLNVNGPWTVGGQLSGWFHHESAESQVYGESGY